MMKQKKRLVFFSAILMTLVFASLACNLFSAQEVEEIVDGVIDIEQPEPEPDVEEEPVWSPEVVFRLDHETETAATHTSVAYSSNGTLIATAILQEINLWDASDGSLIQSIEVDTTNDTIAFTADDSAIATTTSASGVAFVSLADGEEILSLNPPGLAYDSVLDFSPDGGWIVTGGRIGTVMVWDVASGEMLLEMDPGDYVDGYNEWGTSVVYSPNGDLIAAGHWDGTVFIWSAESGELVQTFEPETDSCDAKGLSFSIDGRYLAVGGARVDFDYALRIWDVADGTVVQNLMIDRWFVSTTPVEFSPDGLLLAAGDIEGIWLWSYPDLELLHFIPNENPDNAFHVTDLAFSQDGIFLTAGYSDAYALVWQVQE